MRALVGAIITAAALIGLGLTAQGLGTRYENFRIYKPVAQDAAKADSANLKTEPDFERSYIRFRDIDGPLQLCLTTLLLATVIGLAITFVGLMYHHHRRYHEHLRLHGQPSTPGGGHPIAS